MSETYIARIKKFSENLSDTTLAEHARGIKGNTFSRNRKMPLKDILVCCLSKKGLTTALELRNYFKQKEEYNIMQDIRKAADEKIYEKGRKTGRKKTLHTHDLVLC